MTGPDRPARRALYALMLALVLSVVLAMLQIWYTNHVAEQNNRRWCALLGSLVTPQPTSPPVTPQEVRGRKITEQIRQLHRELGC